jgi:DNA-binding transcriptional ArsR family regulator
MTAGPALARIAFLMGEPARALMLASLMDGRYRTGGELAHVAGVTPSTASTHLTKLADAGLVKSIKQGRYRYFSIASPDVGAALEAMMAIAPTPAKASHRFGPSDAALRYARVCYDHLAGELAVRLAHHCIERGFIEQNDWFVTARGSQAFTACGLDLGSVGKRPLVRPCMDWSERRPHLGGRLGAELLRLFLARGWVRREANGRALKVTSDWTEISAALEKQQGAIICI